VEWNLSFGPTKLFVGNKARQGDWSPVQCPCPPLAGICPAMHEGAQHHKPGGPTFSASRAKASAQRVSSRHNHQTRPHTATEHEGEPLSLEPVRNRVKVKSQARYHQCVRARAFYKAKLPAKTHQAPAFFPAKETRMDQARVIVPQVIW